MCSATAETEGKRKTGGTEQLRNNDCSQRREKDERKIRDKYRLVAGGGVHVEETEGRGSRAAGQMYRR